MSMRSSSTAMKVRFTWILLPLTDLSQRWLVSLPTDGLCEVKQVSYMFKFSLKFISNSFLRSSLGQIILSTLCAFLMKTRKVWLFSTYMLPLLARFCIVSHATLLAINTLSVGLTAAGIGLFLLSNLFVPYRLAKAAYWELQQLEVCPHWHALLNSLYILSEPVGFTVAGWGGQVKVLVNSSWCRRNSIDSTGSQFFSAFKWIMIVTAPVCLKNQQLI